MVRSLLTFSSSLISQTFSLIVCLIQPDSALGVIIIEFRRHRESIHCEGTAFLVKRNFLDKNC
jgi:hypothetical protein